jgi:hypothetical protein
MSREKRILLPVGVRVATKEVKKYANPNKGDPTRWCRAGRQQAAQGAADLPAPRRGQSGRSRDLAQKQQADIDTERANSLLRGDDRMWAAAATKYLKECAQRKVRTLAMISRHVTDLLPYIGILPMQDVCNDALEAFKLDRLEDGVKHATINRSLEVLRTTLIRAARVWRDNGRPWLATAPLIEMLDEAAQKREPYPITWAEQAKLLMRLPAHLQDMVEFSVNTGARDENVCGLQWRGRSTCPRSNAVSSWCRRSSLRRSAAT